MEEIGNSRNNKQKIYASLPYSSYIQRTTQNILRSLNICPAWTTILTANIYTKLENQNEKFLNSNLVYEVKYQSCQAKYTSETSQYLKTRLAQHKYHTKKMNHLHAQLVQHSRDTGHKFDFENTSFKHREQNYIKRIVLEACYIKVTSTTKPTSTTA